MISTPTTLYLRGNKCVEVLIRGKNRDLVVEINVEKYKVADKNYGRERDQD